MATRKEEEPDSSSIRPVSSLLSHFENLHTPTVSSVSSWPSTPSTTSLSQPREQSPKPKPTSASVQNVSITPTSSNSFVTPRAEQKDDSSSLKTKRRPPSPPKPRPLSMLPSSQSKKPPVVDVTAPKSPPNPLHLSSRQLFDQSQSTTSHPEIQPPSSTAPFRAANEQDAALLRPAQSLTQSFNKGRETQRDASPKPVSQSVPPSRSLSPVPPTFDRSAKPKVPAKSSKLTADTKGSAPAMRSTDRRISPFSTPPSSREGSPVEEDPPPVPTNSKPRLPKEGLSATGSFEPSPTDQVVAIRERKSNDPSQADSSVAQAEVSAAEPYSKVRGVPPQLPSRRQPAVSIEPSNGSASQTALVTARPSALTQGFSSKGASSNPDKPISAAKPRPPPREVQNLTPLKHSSRDSSRDSIRPRSPFRQSNIGSDYESGSDAAARHKNQQEASIEFPDISNANRRPPIFVDGPRIIGNGYETRLFDACGEFVCTSGNVTRVWSLLTGKLLLNIAHGEGVKITALAFKPARKFEEDGARIWLGNNYGDIQEVDIGARKIVGINNEAHPRREIVRIQRHATELWTCDAEGILNVWPPDANGSPQLNAYVTNPQLPRGHTASVVVGHELWHATGKEIRVFKPSVNSEVQNIQVLLQSLGQQGTGDAIAAAVIPSQPSRIYFGHSDGKISVFSRSDYSCINVVSVSSNRLTALAGVGKYLWAGFNTGSILVFDTTTQPWRVRKDWSAHPCPIAGMVADRSSIWKLDRLQVLSLDVENTICVWDGMLKDDWIDEEMQVHESTFCSFDELTTLVVTWNAGATKPSDMRYDKRDSNFYQDLFQGGDQPDIIVFGLQELVDLEDKKLTAKNFFKGKNRDMHGHEHMSSVYRAWRDDIANSLEDFMPVNEPYVLLHTASMVGLFTCVFIRRPLKTRVRSVSHGEVKTGMSGLYGNKGALVLRFLLDDSSICLVNCHLAAGQTQTIARNHDITSILESNHFPPLYSSRASLFVNGGDGSMILDHELCILNGDMNYRIDISRDTAINSIRSNNLPKLLDRDQLLMSQRRNPGFKLRAFAEAPLAFAPTYKYDVGTDNYDTSEKRRCPAWCDRILFRGGDRLEQVTYERHEVRVSDHRPVSGRFKMVVKSVQPEKRAQQWEEQQKAFEKFKFRISHEAKLHYLVSVFGVDETEAKRLLEK